jgi:hypothetical protein
MPKKVDSFEEQRNKILIDLFSIIGITEKNNTFSLIDLEQDLDKQNKIYELEEDIKRYFICSSWVCFKAKKIIKRRWLAIVRNLLEHTGYQIFSTQRMITTEENNKKRITMYNIVKI